jgi:hypothetical protein
LSSLRPDLDEAWRLLAGWIAAHPHQKSVSIDRLATSEPRVGAGRLSEAIDVLVDRGLAREVYQVKDTDGTFLSGLYESPRDIPRIVPDRFHEYVDTSERDVVPVILFDIGTGNVRK